MKFRFENLQVWQDAHMIVAKLNALIKSLQTTNFKLPRKSEVKSRKTGFTLIELLVVISILAILSAIGFTAFQSVRSKARDSIRKSDLRKIATALEIYFQNNHNYIQTSVSCSSTDSDTFYSGLNQSGLINGQTPQDPQTHQNYCYITVNNGQGYRLFAKMENPNTNDSNYISNCTNYNWILNSDNLSDNICPPNTPNN